MTEFENELTEDIQHDLAMAYASNEFMDEINHNMEIELHNRGEKLPKNCRWEYSPYAAFKRVLKYDL
jgi:hypothetical protein